MLGGCPVCPESWASEGRAGGLEERNVAGGVGKGCSQGAFWVTSKITTMEL